MRLIDADAFLKSEIERCGCVPLIGSCTSDNEIFKFVLESQPTIDATPIVRGEWKCVDEENEAWECSVCGKIWCLYGTPIDNGMNFCPKCGADMRKKV